MRKIIRECPYCGPRLVFYRKGRELANDSTVCPTCGLDAGEVRAIEEVRSKGFERAYQEEIKRGRDAANGRALGTSG